VWFNAGISTLTVGGSITNDNFANRGDVEVYYTNDSNVISVQMRRFTFADAEDEAAFDKLSLWAYNVGVAPPTPEMAPNKCDEGVWLDSCQIRVYYDGLAQPLRDGADLRVFLPRTWEGVLEIETQDNDFEPERYPDRGDVTVKGAAGSVDVELDAGNVQIEMASDLEEAPLECDADQHQACWDVDWDVADPTCNCTEFGGIRVASRAGRASNVTIETPPDIWISASMQNEQPGINPQSDPLCTATIACDEFDACDLDPLNAGMDWKVGAFINDTDSNIDGAGYTVNVNVGACAEVPFASGPDDFDAEDPESEARGFLHLCSDCLDIATP
jgi:hypothetical protein